MLIPLMPAFGFSTAAAFPSRWRWCGGTDCTYREGTTSSSAGPTTIAAAGVVAAAAHQEGEIV